MNLVELLRSFITFSIASNSFWLRWYGLIYQKERECVLVMKSLARGLGLNQLSSIYMTANSDCTTTDLDRRHGPMQWSGHLHGNKFFFQLHWFTVWPFANQTGKITSKGWEVWANNEQLFAGPPDAEQTLCRVTHYRHKFYQIACHFPL